MYPEKLTLTLELLDIDNVSAILSIWAAILSISQLENKKMIRLYSYVLFEITAEIHYTYTWLKREIRLPLLPLVFLLLQSP